jgi:hypothetical protein
MAIGIIGAELISAAFARRLAKANIREARALRYGVARTRKA